MLLCEDSNQGFVDVVVELRLRATHTNFASYSHPQNTSDFNKAFKLCMYCVVALHTKDF